MIRNEIRKKLYKKGLHPYPVSTIISAILTGKEELDLKELSDILTRNGYPRKEVLKIREAVFS